MDIFGGGAVDSGGGVLDVVNDRFERPLDMLLPNGPAWPRDDETLRTLITALTVEFSRLAVRQGKLARELDPATTFECLADWEESYGLPDCADPVTLAGRRAAIAAKLLAQTGHDQSLTFWTELLAAIGYVLQYVANGLQAMTCTDGCMDALFDEEWHFVWSIIVDHGLEDALLECLVAHNALIGTYPIVHYPWEATDPALGATMFGLACSGQGYLVAVGAGGFAAYTGPDFSWTSVLASAADILAVCAVDEVFLAVGAAPNILQSKTHGASWSPSVVAVGTLRGISRGPEMDSVAVAVGDAGEMWRTDDSGLSWLGLLAVTAHDLMAVTRCTGAMVAVGENGVVLRSTDNGATWSVIAAGITEAMRSVTAWESTVVAVGNEIWRSADAGLTWTMVDSGLADTLYAVTSAPTGRWTACGSGGLIMQSDDDGATWETKTSQTTADLLAACAYLPRGFAVLIGDRFVVE